ncbi:MAG: RHS repeat domain-containing protein [Candidatus Binataceae bacterium]
MIQDERGIARGSTLETTTYTRDSANELITSSLDPLNRTTTFTCDGNNSDITLGNLTSVIWAYGTSAAAETQYSYDPNFSEVDEVIDPSNQVNRTSWQFPVNPANGNVTEFIDPMNRTWQFGYNSAGQITSITDPSPFSYLTQVGYNPTTGDLTSIEDPLGNITNFVTDSRGREISQTTPLNETTSFV